VIRSYHGHLSGVYCVTTHPTLDLLFTGGRDSVCRVWDIRTKAEVMVLGGHRGTVLSVATQAGGGMGPLGGGGRPGGTERSFHSAGRCVSVRTQYSNGRTSGERNCRYKDLLSPDLYSTFICNILPADRNMASEFTAWCLM